jgi:hypothetical protein
LQKSFNNTTNSSRILAIFLGFCKKSTKRIFIMFISWLLARLTERSTWLGVAGMLGALGVQVAPVAADLITNAAIGVAGAILAVTPDANRS